MPELREANPEFDDGLASLDEICDTCKHIYAAASTHLGKSAAPAVFLKPIFLCLI